MTARVVTAPADWQQVLGRFAPAGLDDIYFHPAYAALYAGAADRAEAFIHESGGETFFMPWLARTIDCPVFGRAMSDFETPYGYGGPLATSDDPGFLAEAWAALAALCAERGVVCGFLRFHPLLDNHRFCAGGPAEVVDDRETVVLTLAQDAEAVWQKYSSDTRSKIRKGQKAGVEVVPRTDGDALAIFASLYEAHMKELAAHEDYFFGDDYFQAIPTLGEGAWRVYLAQHDGRVLGGALVLLSRRWAHYHLSSSLKEFSTLVPNNMLRHAVAMDLLGGPWEKLHFGGGRTAAPDDSLLRFKAGYSPERAMFRFGKYVVDRAAYDSLCAWWAEQYPHLVETFGRRFLRYRYR